jgi:hypothetical protein
MAVDRTQAVEADLCRTRGARAQRLRRARNGLQTAIVGEARPASMLLVIPQLVRPEFLVEIEVVAARS